MSNLDSDPETMILDGQHCIVELLYGAGGRAEQLLPLPPVRHVPAQPPAGRPQVRGEGVAQQLSCLPGRVITTFPVVLKLS
jgi:hypothetical protein